jgi:conjugative relaxase-like TrwC/TraI family protein
VTATLHALGCGRGAGSYYTEDPDREARPRTRDDYYSRDSKGTWWSPGSSLVRSGATVDAETFRDLCAGLDPRTGKNLVRGAGARHRAGWDITFSTPKTFGILWAAGDASQRAVLERIQQEAVDQALAFVVDERLVEVRLGAGGRLREAPADIVVAKFPHFTSREGDPACHTHSVLLNLARSADGKKVLTVEPKRIYGWQLVLGSAFRTALSQKLSELGFALRPAGRDQFEIAGIPEEMIEHFSKRSKQIEARVGRDASAAEKEVANLSTRRSKATVPTEQELEERWKQELASFGIDPWATVLEAGRAPRPRLTPEVSHDFDLPEIPGNTSVALASSAILRTESVLTRKALLHRSFVEAAMQGQSIEAVYTEISALEAAEKLVRLDQHSQEAGQHWTTPAILSGEVKLLRLVQERVAGSWFKPEAVEAALSAAPYLTGEQRLAVRHATSPDPTCVLESGAGTGKTTLIRCVVDAGRRSGTGLEFIGLAPSWIAADELTRSTGIEAIAIARFRHELATGQRPAPGPNTLIIVDEAGMVGMRDMAAIFAAAASIGTTTSDPLRCAKILLSGDRRQLASVSGGSVLKIVSDSIERKATMSGVRRQSVEWQRAASIVMAQGDSQAGLRAYAEHGGIDLIAGSEAAQARTIRAWQEFRHSHGDEVLIITRRNRDAVALNLIARKILREEGAIRGDDLKFLAIDRDGTPGLLLLAIGDHVRFGETLHQHRIRNGTQGTVEGCWQNGEGSGRVGIRLEDGRLIHDAWAGFANRRRCHHAGVPKIVHGIAGSAYAAQGRTASAAVHYVGSVTDARETYVALTRHRHDVRIVVESERLDSSNVCSMKLVDITRKPM